VYVPHELPYLFMMPCCDVAIKVVGVSLKWSIDAYRTDLLPGNLLIQNTILIRYNAHNYAVLAQLVEHSAVNRAVTGPSPVDGVPTSFFAYRKQFFVKSHSNLQSKFVGHLFY
jgi:hypothetical protein